MSSPATNANSDWTSQDRGLSFLTSPSGSGKDEGGTFPPSPKSLQVGAPDPNLAGGQIASRASTDSLQTKLWSKSLDLPRKYTNSLGRAYIHDDFEAAAAGINRKSSPTPVRSRSSSTPPLPPHLLFDITKTQVTASIVRKQKPRDAILHGRTSNVPFTSHETTDLPPSRSIQLGRNRSGVLSAEPRLVPLSMTGTSFVERPATVQGYRTGALQTKASRSRDRAIQAKWQELTASNEKLSIERTAGRRFSSAVPEAATIESSQDVHTIRRQYELECMQPDGSTPIPATNRRLPHIVVENEANRALSVLSVIRQHDYIRNSPAHTRAFTLSERGYVEYNKKGLSEFYPMRQLGNSLHQYSLAHRHVVFGKFREYKTFRRWDYVVRRRKFRSKRAALEKLMLQTHREGWAVVQRVKAECVTLQGDVSEDDMKPVSTGISLEQLSAEIQRRREILQDAVDGTRLRISELLTRFCAAVSGTNKVERLREIFKYNRRGEEVKAEEVAGADMHLLCRIWCLAEHIVAQTAAELYNNELHRVVRFFQTEAQSILQVEAFFRVDLQALISLKLPYSPDDTAAAEQATELVVVPGGGQVEETLIKDLQSIYLALSYSMRPILVPDLSSFVVESLLALYLPRKPEFVSLVTRSRDAIRGHDQLVALLQASDQAATQHCATTLGHLRPLMAYTEAFVVARPEELRASIQAYPEEAGEFHSWLVSLTKLAAHDADLGAFRLKYRKVKTHLQERLQTKVIDRRFADFQQMVVETIVGIKLIGSKYTKDLEMIAATFADLKLLLGTVHELHTGIHVFTKSIQDALAMRDTLLHQYRNTSAWIESNETAHAAGALAPTVQSKLALPTLSSNLADNVKTQVQNAKVRLMNQREQHVGIVKREIEAFSAQITSYQQQLKGSKLQSFSEPADDALATLGEMGKQVAVFDQRAETIKTVLKWLSLPPLNTSMVTDAHESLESLVAIWSGIREWKALHTLVMDTALPVLQQTDLVSMVAAATATVSQIIQKYSAFPVAQALQAEFHDFDALWPLIKMLTDPAMKKAHLDALFQGSGKDKPDLIHVDVHKVTVAELVRRRLLGDAGRLGQMYELAVQEDQVFVLMDKLRASTEGIKVTVREQDETMWLEGVEAALAECADNSLLIEWIRQGPFANLTSRDIMKFKQRNKDAHDMLLQLQYCQSSWNAVRALKWTPECLTTDEVADVRTTLYKWIKCIIALSMDQGVIALHHVDYPQVLRVQEVAEEMARVRELLAPVYTSLCADCHRFGFVTPTHALLVASTFATKGPAVDPAVLSLCFPNVFHIEFSSRRVPSHVWGANKEMLQLPEDRKDSWALRNELRKFSAGLKTAVRTDIFACLHELRARQGFQGDEWKGKHRVQSLLVALSIRWSDILRGEGEASAAADRDSGGALERRVERAREMVMRFLVGEAEQGATQDLSLARRRKESALMLLALHWRDALDTRPRSTQTASLDRFRGLFLYRVSGEDLTVDFGPVSTSFGFAFCDGTSRVVCPPSSWKLALYLLSCMRSCSCGVVEETAQGPGGQAGCGGGGLSLMAHAAQACGQYLHVVECDQDPPLDALLRLPVALEAPACNTWLCVRDPHRLAPTSSIAALAQQIHTTLTQLAAITVVSRPPPCIAFLTGPALPSALADRVPLSPCLPLAMRDALRPFQADPPDSRVLLEVLLQAARFPSAVGVARQLDKALRIIALGIRPLEAFFLSPPSLRAVVEAAESLVHASGEPLASLAALHPRQVGDRRQERRSSLPEAGEDKDEHHALYAAAASALLGQGRRLLSDCSYESCKWAVFLAFGPMGVEVQSVESHWDGLFASKVQFVMQARHLKATDRIVSSCVSLYRALTDDRRPIILHGPPQSGKSQCLNIVRLARYVDLNNPGKEALCHTFCKSVAPMAFFSRLDEDTGLEGLGTQGRRELREYVEWFGSSLIQNTFMYLDRWLVLDVPDASAVDTMLLDVWQRQQSVRPFLPRHTQRPAIMIETASIAHSAPSALAASHLVGLYECPVGWEEVYHKFLEEIRPQLEPRTLQELQSLAHSHLPEISAFIDKECRLALSISTAAIARTLSSIIHYHFFLGRDTATRRTVVFTRAAFVFAIAWSFGAVLDAPSKAKFDPWLQDRMRKAKISSFVQPDRGQVATPLWYYYVSFTTMNLRPFSETAEAFASEERAHVAAELVLCVPTERMRMQRLLWTILRTREENILFHGEAGCGRSKLVAWLHAQHHGFETLVAYSQLHLKPSSDTAAVQEFIRTQQAKVSDKGDGGKLVLMIDDVHLPLQGAEAGGTGSAVGELLRTFMERRMLLVKGDLHEDQILQSALVVATGLTRHLHAADPRLLGRFSCIAMEGGSAELNASVAKVIGASFLDSTGATLAVRTVMDRLPAAVTAVFEWAQHSLAPSSMHELLLQWDTAHLRGVIASLAFINWRQQHDLDYAFRFLWHEIMRVFSDRMGNLAKIQTFRLQAQQLLAKHIGSKLNRSLRLAVDSHTYHVMLPPATEADTASAATSPGKSVSWTQNWTVNEMSVSALEQKGTEAAMAAGGSLWHAVCVSGFGRHLSHALRVLRPYTWVQACILYGPPASGRHAVLRVAAAMCGYRLYEEGPDKSAAHCLSDIQAALLDKGPSLLVLSTQGPLQDPAVRERVQCLITGRTLDKWEHQQSLSLRFAFCVDLGPGASPVQRAAPRLPPQLEDLARFASVDWYEGWSDASVLRLIQRQVWTSLQAHEGLSKQERDAVYQRTPHHLYRIHRCLEGVVEDLSGPAAAQLYPHPKQAAAFGKLFVEAYVDRLERMRARTTDLEHAIERWTKLNDKFILMESQREEFKPILRTAVETQLKWRSDTLHFERVANRARKIAEADEINGMMSVLYGDAPGYDIHKEYQNAQRQLTTALKGVADLKKVHFIQLEMVEVSAFPELLGMLQESICICFAEQIGHDSPSLRDMAPELQERIAKLDVGKIGLVTINRLRSYVVDTRFIPERMFAINRAAGVLCYWVRSVERYARANEWIKPDSTSNQNQSLDRVREMSRKQIMAVEEVDTGVQAAKTRHAAAIRKEASTREQMAALERELQDAKELLGSLTPDFTQWQLANKDLGQTAVTHLGDSVLFAASVAYLGFFKHEQRQLVLQTVTQVLNTSLHAALDSDPDEPTLVDGVQCSVPFSLERHLQLQRTVEGLPTVEMTESRCFREGVLHVVMLHQQSQIPLIVDPLGKAHVWLQETFGSRLRVFVRGGTADVIRFLRQAKQQDCPALLLHAELTIPHLIEAFRVDSSLRPGGKAEAGAFSESGFCVLLISTCKEVELGTAEMALLSVVDLTPDEEWLEEISFDAVMRCLMPDAFAAWKHQQEQGLHIKRRIAVLAEGLRETFCSIDVVAEVGQGGAVVQHVEQCRELSRARAELQAHVVESMELMRETEHLRGLAKRCAQVLACFWGICAASRCNLFALPLLDRVLHDCSANRPLEGLQAGSVAFRRALHSFAEAVTESTARFVTMAVDPSLHSVCRVMLVAAQGNDEVSAGLRGLQSQAAVMLEGKVDKMKSYELAVRGVGPCGVFSAVGWQCLRAIRDVIGQTLYHEVVSSVEERPEEWMEMSSRPGLPSALPDLGDHAPTEIERMLIACCFAPFKLSDAISHLCRAHCEQPVRQGLLDSAALISRNTPDTPLLLLPSRSTPAHNCVMRLLFTVREALQAIERKGIRGVQVVRVGADEEEMVDGIQQAKEQDGWLLVEEEGHMVQACVRSLLNEMVTASTDSGLRCCVSAKAGTPAARQELFHGRLVDNLVQSSVASRSVGLAVGDSSDPRELLLAVVADCWGREASVSACRLRSLVGLCYWHAAVRREQDSATSSLLYWAPKVTTQSLLMAARLLFACGDRPDAEGGAAMAVVRDAAYATLFRCQLSSDDEADDRGPLVRLLTSVFSEGLYRDKQQLRVMDVMMDAPDKLAGGWKGLWSLCSGLNASFSMAWAAAGAPSQPLEVESALTQSRCVLGPLAASQRSHAAQPVLSDAIELLASLSAAVPPRLPAARARETLRTQEAATEPTEGEGQGEDDVAALHKREVLEECDALNAAIALVTSDMEHLASALHGRRVLDAAALELYEHLRGQSVPHRWDDNPIRRCKVLPLWVEGVRERATWFGGQLAALKLIHHVRVPAPLVPLSLYAMPRQLLQLLLLADAVKTPGRVGRDMRFLVTPAEHQDAVRAPLHDGAAVKGVMFRCAFFEPSTGVLHQLQAGPSSVTPAGDLHLQPMDRKRLPHRASMKKACQHWCSVRLYRFPPPCIHPTEPPVSTEPLCELIVRSSFHPSRASAGGVFAFLSHD